MSHLNLDNLPLTEYQEFYNLCFECNNPEYVSKKILQLQNKAARKKFKSNFC